jgi:hypothetical protein
MTLTELLAVYGELLYLPDPTPILGALATVAANRIPDDDPVWTVLVGPPSSGKSEIIDSLRGLPEMASLSTLTSKSLLSGHANSRGGLLLTRFRDGNGFLLVKDFTTILSEAPATRNELLALLREVYDGHIERAVGNQATILAWAGKLGFLTGVTEEIEQHRTTIAIMGERFLYLPMSTATEIQRAEVARRAIAHPGRRRQVRDHLIAVVAEFFRSLPGAAAVQPISAPDSEWLIAAADLASRARSAVPRDSRTRDIELVPDPELPARLMGEFSSLWRGMGLIGASRAQAQALILGALLGGIPKVRRRALLVLLEGEQWTHTVQVVARIRTPQTTVHHVLEDLAAIGVIDSNAGTGPVWSAQSWAPTPQTRQLWTDLNQVAPKPGSRLTP